MQLIQQIWFHRLIDQSLELSLASAPCDVLRRLAFRPYNFERSLSKSSVRRKDFQQLRNSRSGPHWRYLDAELVPGGQWLITVSTAGLPSNLRPYLDVWDITNASELVDPLATLEFPTCTFDGSLDLQSGWTSPRRTLIFLHMNDLTNIQSVLQR